MHLYFLLCVEMKESWELGEMEEFDPAYPHVLLLMCRWYGRATEVANIMITLYPSLTIGQMPPCPLL